MPWLLKRWWVWSIAIVTTLLLATAALLIASTRTTITPENCDKIKVGMTEQEVEALLGERPSGGFGANVVMAAFWSDEEENTIIVEFWGAKAVGKRFMEGKLSTWERMQKRFRRILLR
jgi:hypothetical protein